MASTVRRRPRTLGEVSCRPVRSRPVHRPTISKNCPSSCVCNKKSLSVEDPSKLLAHLQGSRSSRGKGIPPNPCEDVVQDRGPGYPHDVGSTRDRSGASQSHRSPRQAAVLNDGVLCGRFSAPDGPRPTHAEYLEADVLPPGLVEGRTNSVGPGVRVQLRHRHCRRAKVFHLPIFETQNVVSTAPGGLQR